MNLRSCLQQFRGVGDPIHKQYANTIKLVSTSSYRWISTTDNASKCWCFLNHASWNSSPSLISGSIRYLWAIQEWNWTVRNLSFYLLLLSPWFSPSLISDVKSDLLLFKQRWHMPSFASIVVALVLYLLSVFQTQPFPKLCTFTLIRLNLIKF